MLPVRRRGLLRIWSDRVPGAAPTDVAASAASTTKSGPVDFDFKAEAAALVDFPDVLEAGFGGRAESAALVDFPDVLAELCPDDALETDFGTMAEARALVDFPDTLEGGFGARAESAALGASPFGCAADCLAMFRCASVNGITQTARSRST
jgi:hypothetical protein